MSKIELNKKPILSDLRESGSIEQDADLVLMLYKIKILI
jgi:replicative DNA helicase